MSEETMCAECGTNPGTVKVRHIVGDLVEDLLLCDVCAARHGIDRSDHWMEPRVGDMLEHLIDPRAAEDLDGPRCPTCGTDKRALRRTGTVGCADCYRSLEPEIRRLVGELRSGRTVVAAGARHYRGKIPRKLRRYKALFVDRALVKERLDDALARESYEDAAQLRDELSRLDRRIEKADGPADD